MWTILGRGGSLLCLVSRDCIGRRRLRVGVVLEDRIRFRFGLQLVNVRLSTSCRVIHGFTQNNSLELLRDNRPNFLGIVVKLGPLFASHEDTFTC